ncbi:hypothetical protein [Xanthomonas hortorum]|uniref:hypothetical protein n=1 Tax=Xanthomonas hortorum TaxID=56454 RepID=UPI0032E88B44
MDSKLRRYSKLGGRRGSPYPDFIIGTLIGLYVIKEAVEILGDARRARQEARDSSNTAE